MKNFLINVSTWFHIMTNRGVNKGIPDGYIFSLTSFVRLTKPKVIWDEKPQCLWEIALFVNWCRKEQSSTDCMIPQADGLGLYKMLAIQASQQLAFIYGSCLSFKNCELEIQAK